MGSALEEFRAQRDAVQEVHARLAEVAELLRSLKEQAAALARDEDLRELLQEEQTWLMRAEDVIRTGRHARECELQRFWPGVWRRWVMAVGFAFAMAVAAGAGYAWANRPNEVELLRLRSAADVGDAVARRVLEMTPTERRQFDALIKVNVTAGR
jgi:hypothetical protein